MAKAQARQAGVEIVDLSIGTPDLAPPPEALDALKVRGSPASGACLPCDASAPSAGSARA